MGRDLEGAESTRTGRVRACGSAILLETWLGLVYLFSVTDTNWRLYGFNVLIV